MSMLSRRLALAVLLSGAAITAHADNTAQSLPFTQAWTNAGLITVNDNWSGVPGIEGFLGQDITTATGTNPQTLTGTSALANDLDVVANQSNTSITNGGVIEFDGIANPAVALQGSGTADAPYLLIHLNTTGQSGINVAYNLRDLDGSADNAVQPVALQYRVGSSGAFIDVPAGFVADATTGPSLATLVTAVSATLPAGADNQSLVQVRIITANAAGNDESVGIDDINITAGGGGSPVLSVTDTSAAEGNAGTTTFFFTFNLSSPAGVGGVSINYATADGTATAGSDYVSASATANIAEGASSVTIGVEVNGDTTTEANETFFVNITSATGATVGDAQGIGTINNDDVTVTPIHDIQGPGASSPLLGQSITTVGIVTGRKSNGFFLQTADAEADANPNTSQGVFVFTSAAPPAAASVGNRVQVTGNVVEFVPTQDPLQPPLTEIGGSPTVLQLSSGNPLPAPIALTATFPDPAGAFDQLERLEGMRVSVASFTVAAPTGGNTNEPNATGTSNGVFHGVVTGVARPFREPGIQAPDPAPAGGSIPPIPRWDFNPELITVDSDALGASQLNLSIGAVLTNMTGPLDYSFRRYTVLPETTPTVTAGVAPSAARAPTADEFTVASYNLERFFDTVNDPAIGEPVLTATAFANRLNKASLAIRNFLNTPDIVGVVEVENLSALQALAAKISTDAIAASQPDPQYVAYLTEGNDVGGIDVGFLVKSAEVAAGIDRVEVVSVVQQGATTPFVNPDASTELLNDRPPLVLSAIVHYADGRQFPITAIVVHQRSLNDVESTQPGSNGWSTAGDRVRAKRLKQAEFLANLIQGMQNADAQRRITVLGDFNAFEFNDGYVDAMNVVAGTPVADNQTAVPGDGVDLVNPDLLNLFSEEPADQRYSFVFGGNAQSLDHILINQALGTAAADFSLDHARINADFPETNRNDANTPSRLSDHDPAVAYFAVSAADLAVTASATPASVVAGATMTFNATVTNHGPNGASSPGVGFALNAALPGLTVTAPNGWTCDTPTINNGNTSVACATSTLANAGSAAFQLTATAPVAQAGQAIQLAVLATSQTADNVPGNNAATATVNVTETADLSFAFSGPELLTRTSTTATYRARLTNSGPTQASNTQIVIRINVPRENVQIVKPDDWGCGISGIPNFEMICAPLAGPVTASAVRDFDLTINNVGRLRVPRIKLDAQASSSAADAQPSNNRATADIRVVGVTPF